MSSTISLDSSRFDTVHGADDPLDLQLRDWLTRYIAQILNVAPDRIDPDLKFDRHGLDSSAAVGLAGDLGAWIGCELDPALTYDFPTIAELAAELARRDDIRAALQPSM